MAEIVQLEPTLPFDTPLGPAWAHFMFHQGDDHHIQWHCCLEYNGAWVTFENIDVRMGHNMTMGRPQVKHRWRKYWKKASKSIFDQVSKCRRKQK